VSPSNAPPHDEPSTGSVLGVRSWIRSRISQKGFGTCGLVTKSASFSDDIIVRTRDLGLGSRALNPVLTMAECDGQGIPSQAILSPLPD